VIKENANVSLLGHEGQVAPNVAEAAYPNSEAVTTENPSVVTAFISQNSALLRPFFQR